MELTLKNVKIFEGMSKETTAYTGVVYIDGKRAGHVRNDGSGGSDIVDWTDYGLSAAYREWLDKETMVRPDPSDPEKIWLVEPGWKLEIVLSEALESHQEKMWFKKKCRGMTLFRLKSDGDEASWRTVNAKFDKGVEVWLKDRYGDDLAEIANETRI